MAIMIVRKILILFRLLLNGNREQAITVKGFQNKSNIKFHCQVLSLEDLTLPCCRHVGPPPKTREEQFNGLQEKRDITCVKVAQKSRETSSSCMATTTPKDAFCSLVLDFGLPHFSEMKITSQKPKLLE